MLQGFGGESYKPAQFFDPACNRGVVHAEAFRRDCHISPASKMLEESPILNYVSHAATCRKEGFTAQSAPLKLNEATIRNYEPYDYPEQGGLATA